MKFESLNRARLSDVFPNVANATLSAIAKTEDENPGWYGRVTEGVRSIEKQITDWLKGRDTLGNIIDKALVVTNAKDEKDSPHVAGLASDTEWVDGSGKVATKDAPIWSAFGANIKGAGLDWGGDFASLDDKPHAQAKNWRQYIGWKVRQFVQDEPVAASGLGTVFGLGALFGIGYFLRKALSKK